jgi:hypothetical protein
MARTKPRKARKASPILENLMQEVASETSYTQTLINPAGEISISDAISQIIEPYRKTATNYDSFYKLVMLACAAWNACILPAEESESMLQAMLAALPSEAQARTDFMGTINALMARKKKLFPHVSRMIVKFKVTDRGNDFHIAVASTLGK